MAAPEPRDFWQVTLRPIGLCCSSRRSLLTAFLSLLLLPHVAASQSSINPFQIGSTSKPDPSSIERLTRTVNGSPDSLAARMDLGIALAQWEQWQPALEQFTAAERIDPSSAEAAYDCGLTYLMMAGASRDHSSIDYYRQLDLGEHALTRALELNPRLPKIHEYLGRLYHLIGDQDSSTRQFRIEVELDPESAESLNNLGTSLAETGHYDESVDCYEKALALDLKCTSCLLNLQGAIQRQGATMAAVRRYEAAARNQPTSPVAHLLYGMILTVSHGQPDLAIEELRWSLKTARDLAAAHVYLGELYRQNGEDVTAEGEYRQAIEITPGRVDFLDALATVLLEENKSKDAQAVLQKALVLDPGNPSLHYKLSRVLQRSGQSLEASRERVETARLEKADQDESKFEVNLNRGIADLRSGNATDAVADLKLALSLKPNHPETNFYLGIALSEIGDSSGSSQAFREALERRPESAEIHYNFGIALWKEGESAPAIAELRRTTAIRPEDAMAHCALGIALLRTGNSAEGQREISRARQLGACRQKNE
jgi:protein O-GlcNAc transferase